MAMFSDADPVLGLISAAALMFALYLLGDGLFGFEPDREPHGPRPLPPGTPAGGDQPQRQRWPDGRYLRYYRLLRTDRRE